MINCEYIELPCEFVINWFNENGETEDVGFTEVDGEEVSVKVNNDFYGDYLFRPTGVQIPVVKIEENENGVKFSLRFPKFTAFLWNDSFGRFLFIDGTIKFKSMVKRKEFYYKLYVVDSDGNEKILEEKILPRQEETE